VGYSTGDILEALDKLLGFREQANAIVIGCGALGSALLKYPGFLKYGLRIAAAFDVDHQKVGQRVGEYMILPMEKCRSVIETFRVEIAIIATPADSALEITPWLIERGIKALWNFAPVKLRTPPHIAVRDENLALGLAQLIHDFRSHGPITPAPDVSRVSLEEV
jgi:redox-sensing transcriptional repressor